MHPLRNEAWVSNQRKKAAIDIAIRLYYDTLQYWYVKDFVAYYTWVEEVWWREEGWRQMVARVQAQVYEEERRRLSRFRRNRTTRAMEYAAWWQRAGRPMQ